MNLFVLGMHRSGTSLVTSLLAEMGFNIGDSENLFDRDTHNKHGYWERKDVVSLNTEMLRSQNSSWYDLDSFDVNRFTDKNIEFYTDQIKKILDNLGSTKQWVIKDPRMCLLLPLWKRCAPDTATIFVYRHPYEIAASLNSRDYFPELFSMALWETYCLHALRDGGKEPKLLVSFHDLIENPSITIESLVQNLEMIDGNRGRYSNLSPVNLASLVDSSITRTTPKAERPRRLSTRNQSYLVECFETGNLPDPENLFEDEHTRLIIKYLKPKILRDSDSVLRVSNLEENWPSENTKNLVATLRSRIDELHEKNQKAHENNRILHESIAEISKTNLGMQELYSNLASKFSDAVNKLDESSNKFSKLSANTKNISEEFKAAKNLLSNKLSEIEDENAGLREKLANFKTTKDENAGLREKLANFKTALEHQEEEIKSTQHELKLFRSWTAIMSEEIDQLLNSSRMKLIKRLPDMHGVRNGLWEWKPPLERKYDELKKWNLSFLQETKTVEVREKNPRTSAPEPPEEFEEIATGNEFTTENHQVGRILDLSKNLTWTLKNKEKGPVRAIAFYLPQFHPIPENDEWWGKGFTEWHNVSKARKLYKGHYQPRIPSELGFYDLRINDIREQQFALAEEHGIHGFCYHYYWFQGKRLLERPLDDLVASNSSDHNFCICWANENWSRTWDGAPNDVLIAQDHNSENFKAFIEDLTPYLLDDRYIRVDDRPIIIIYQANLIPNTSLVSEIWRDHCHKHGVGEIYLISALTFDNDDPRPHGFDAAVEYPPHKCGFSYMPGHTPDELHRNFEGKLFDYRVVVEESIKNIQNYSSEFPRIGGVMPSWDNTARRPFNNNQWINSSPEVYQAWLEAVAAHASTRHDELERLVFINAWNEWAEGCHLEPCTRYERQYLEATKHALSPYL